MKLVKQVIAGVEIREASLSSGEIGRLMCSRDHTSGFKMAVQTSPVAVEAPRMAVEASPMSVEASPIAVEASIR